jgi:hypothetical protein
MTFDAQKPYASLVLALLPHPKKMGKRTAVTVSLRQMDIELSPHISYIRISYFYPYCIRHIKSLYCLGFLLNGGLYKRAGYSIGANCSPSVQILLFEVDIRS